MSGKRRGKKPEVRSCKVCGDVIPFGFVECPKCGKESNGSRDRVVREVCCWVGVASGIFTIVMLVIFLALLLLAEWSFSDISESAGEASYTWKIPLIFLPFTIYAFLSGRLQFLVDMVRKE